MKVSEMRLRRLAAGAMVFVVGAPAFAQDYGYGPRERYRDDLGRPYGIDGLGLGRDAPFISSEDLGRGPGTRGRSFEIEAPPIGSHFIR